VALWWLLIAAATRGLERQPPGPIVELTTASCCGNYAPIASHRVVGSRRATCPEGAGQQRGCLVAPGLFRTRALVLVLLFNTGGHAQECPKLFHRTIARYLHV